MNLELRVVLYLAIGTCFSLHYGSLVALGLVFGDIIARQIPWKRIYSSTIPWKVFAPFIAISVGVASTFFGFFSLGLLIILYGYFVIGMKVIKVFKKECEKAKETTMGMITGSARWMLNKIFDVPIFGWMFSELIRTVLQDDDVGCPAVP